ncbi:hypothetical protein QEO94_07645 [Kingella negevensis]|uniref:XAC2610-related protein n=1 Tax=Kingella negevensis TaxID=1522312 RepID=UPI002542918C|nr:hypothetical protein [Kingella negevensis]WII92515.1 hypothetical protein QEO94_07645 [Kingella negevensis]
MKRILALLLISTFAQAEDTALTRIQLTKGVTVERDLASKDGQYLFLVRTGTWQINGSMFNRANNHQLHFTGTQKGYTLNLQSTANAENSTQPEFLYNGTLNLQSNRIDGVMTTPDKQQAITFEPYLPVANRPAFQFKFYGTPSRQVTQVQVLQNNKVVQTLSGFVTNDNEATYADYNFDGYFDLRLDSSDTSHQYWLYNPKTKKFQFDSELSQYAEVPQRYPHKYILKFGNTLLERRNSKWYEIPCCTAIN